MLMRAEAIVLPEREQLVGVCHSEREGAGRGEGHGPIK